MMVRRIGPLSCGSMVGAVYAGIGLLVGSVVSVFAVMGAAVGMSGSESDGALLGLFFGIGSIVILPIMYGVFGFLGGLVGASIYNLAAGVVGGLQLDVDMTAPPAPAPGTQP